MSWLSKLFDNDIRAEAERLGMVVSDIDRDLPDFRTKKIAPGRCVRYALPRTSRKNWKLLQRFKEDGGQYSGLYLVEGDSVTPELIERLRFISDDYPEEFFEFEGKSNEVAVYWEEWGGKAMVNQLYETLLKLKDI